MAAATEASPPEQRTAIALLEFQLVTVQTVDRGGLPGLVDTPYQQQLAVYLAAKPPV